MALVLVVEDEFGIATLLADVLTDEGHRVVLAANGRQGLARAAEERPSIVLTDYMMPVMDGAALVNAFAADEDLAAIPIVMMSSMPESVIAEQCSGYRAFVRKPFRVFELADLVARLLADQGDRS